MARILQNDTPATSTSLGKDFNAGFRQSLYLHLGIALIVILKGLVFPSQPIRYTPALRVDIVGLPDILKKDLPKVQKSNSEQNLTDALKTATQAAQQIKPIKIPIQAPTKAEPITQDEIAFRPKKIQPKTEDVRKKNTNALARIRSLDKLAEPEHPKGVVIRGNAISHGTSLSGDAKESTEDNYLDILRDRLQENWELPVWLARQKLAAQAQIFLDSQGRLHHFRLTKSSGNPQFDDAVKRSIQASQPFPPPPKNVVSAISSNGVLIGFPL